MTLWSALITFLLILTIAKSTVAAAWVPGVDVYPLVAIAGALLMGVLAVTPLPWWWCVSLGMALGPLVAGLLSAPAFRGEHPLDPSGLALIQAWITRIQDGSAFADSAFVVFVITWLMWVTGAWLSWCVLRWRQPLTGLIPGAAAFATNVLNSADQNSYTLAFLVLTFALLLWTNYTASIARAVKARVKLTGDARWDFWESGLVATAALIVLGIMLPPLSTVDRTQTMESSLFTDWAQLQQQLNRPDLGTGTGTGAIGTTGFSTDVVLGGSLTKSKTLVFTYTVTGQYTGPRYFRGVNVTVTDNGEWTYENNLDVRQPVKKGDIPNYGESYASPALATFNINMVSPPGGNTDILFYPGKLYKVDRNAIAGEVQAPPPGSATSQLVTIDRLSSVPPNSHGNYNITVEYPDVQESDLRSAGTNYPAWLEPYMGLPPDGYRSADVMKRIHDLAVSLTAGLTNPYDKATAIQNYLRSSAFTYHLTVAAPPTGVDRLDYFLFTSHDGYCQYFAAAMGDMLRSIGIPTRLVNGFGAGQYNASLHLYEVRGEDAHTWVESYFPGDGWIPFEPTADGTYTQIQRGSPSGPNLCLIDKNCSTPTGSTGSAVPVTANPGRLGGNADSSGGAGPAGLRFGVPDANTITRIVGVLLAVLLLLVAFGARYLRPRSVMGVWKRTLVLARLAGADVRPGETPLELSRRLSRVFPEVAASVRSLANGFVVAAYAPPGMAESTRATVMEAWTSLRPLMLKRVAGRFRPGRA